MNASVRKGIQVMSETDWVYLNGEFLPASEARVSPFDRGFLFSYDTSLIRKLDILLTKRVVFLSLLLSLKLASFFISSYLFTVVGCTMYVGVAMMNQ